MHGDLVVLGVLLGALAFLLLAERTGIPYPIPLTAGGAALAFLPGVTDFELAPEMILVAFLPPLLYATAFFASLQDLRANWRPISALAVGLVIATTVAVAVAAHAVVGGLSWPAAFVLGAIVSPTDPVAAVEIAVRSRAPRRLVTIVEGESLINDSTGLIAYKFAVAAAVTGSFSVAHAAGDFLVSAAGGIAIGLLVGWPVAELRRRLDDAPTEIAVSLVTPYIAYLPAEAAGVSAVLAAVTSGLYLGWRSPELVTPATRIQAVSFWEILVFALNAALFVLVGLQLHTVINGLDGFSTAELALDAAVVCGTVIATRFAWVLPFNIVTRLLVRRFPRRHGDDPPDTRLAALLGWSGMRGAVSLAAALAIPLQTDAGTPFPQRDLIIFLAYTVIVVTVVGQGLTLGRLIDLAGVYDDEETVAEQEARARIQAAEAAIARLDELQDQDWVRDQTHERMRALYEYRIRRFASRLDDEDDGDLEQRSQDYQRLRRKVLEAERAEMIRLRNRGEITDGIMRRMERDLDLEDARLEI
jgi:CPA1 family monovalent cation:H+ antiporter